MVGWRLASDWGPCSPSRPGLRISREGAISWSRSMWRGYCPCGACSRRPPCEPPSPGWRLARVSPPRRTPHRRRCRRAFRASSRSLRAASGCRATSRRGPSSVLATASALALFVGLRLHRSTRERAHPGFEEGPSRRLAGADALGFGHGTRAQQPVHGGGPCRGAGRGPRATSRRFVPCNSRCTTRQPLCVGSSSWPRAGVRTRAPEGRRSHEPADLPLAVLVPGSDLSPRLLRRAPPGCSRPLVRGHDGAARGRGHDGALRSGAAGRRSREVVPGAARPLLPVVVRWAGVVDLDARAGRHPRPRRGAPTHGPALRRLRRPRSRRRAPGASAAPLPPGPAPEAGRPDAGGVGPVPVPSSRVPPHRRRHGRNGVARRPARRSLPRPRCRRRRPLPLRRRAENAPRLRPSLDLRRHLWRGKRGRERERADGAPGQPPGPRLVRAVFRPGRRGHGSPAALGVHAFVGPRAPGGSAAPRPRRLRPSSLERRARRARDGHPRRFCGVRWLVKHVPAVVTGRPGGGIAHARSRTPRGGAPVGKARSPVRRERPTTRRPAALRGGRGDARHPGGSGAGERGGAGAAAGGSSSGLDQRRSRPRSEARLTAPIRSSTS